MRKRRDAREVMKERLVKKEEILQPVVNERCFWRLNHL
jgi:hypothetical protein